MHFQSSPTIHPMEEGNKSQSGSDPKNKTRPPAAAAEVIIEEPHDRPPQTEKAKFENKIEIESKGRRQSDKEN
jgi:hypothetical protein